jgi:hypothetical protein
MPTAPPTPKCARRPSRSRLVPWPSRGRHAGPDSDGLPNAARSRRLYLDFTERGASKPGYPTVL